ADTVVRRRTAVVPLADGRRGQPGLAPGLGARRGVRCHRRPGRVCPLGQSLPDAHGSTVSWRDRLLATPPRPRGRPPAL
ncbi:MAG: hypothetical protein AVDCRST_MAG49-4742, partial [uncultured Thermomicrobiales bacterium]